MVVSLVGGSRVGWPRDCSVVFLDNNLFSIMSLFTFCDTPSDRPPFNSQEGVGANIIPADRPGRELSYLNFENNRGNPSLFILQNSKELILICFGSIQAQKIPVWVGY